MGRVLKWMGEYCEAATGSMEAMNRRVTVHAEARGGHQLPFLCGEERSSVWRRVRLMVGGRVLQQPQAQHAGNVIAPSSNPSLPPRS